MGSEIYKDIVFMEFIVDGRIKENYYLVGYFWGCFRGIFRFSFRFNFFGCLLRIFRVGGYFR